MTHHLRAHNASRVSNCPGSLRLQYGGKREDVDNPNKAFGREMHSLVEDVIGGELPLEEIEDEEHREWVGRCVDFIVDNVSDLENYDIRLERPLFVLGRRGEHIASARADCLIRESGGSAIVPDWKFYRFPLNFEEHQLQLLVMCVGVLQEFPKVDVVQGILYLPILNHTHNLDLSRDLLDEALIQLELVWEEGNAAEPQLTPGAWCAQCPCLARCPAAIKSIRKIDDEVGLEKYLEMPKLPAIRAMTTGILKRIHTLSPARFRRLVELFPLLAPLQDAIRTKLRADLERDAASHVGWELKERRGPASASPEDLRTVAGDFDISREEFDKECMSVSVASFRKLLAAKLKEQHPEAKKKDIDESVREALEPIIQQEELTILQRRR